MIRRLIGAAIAVAALSMAAAAFASPAGAEIFQAGAYPATVAGKATSELKISNGTRTLVCANASMSGALSSASEELKVTPSLPECKGTEGLIYLGWTIKPGGLDIHFEQWTFIFPDYFIKITLPSWTWDWFTSEKEFKEEKPPACSFEVPEAGNTAVGTLTGTNEGSGTGRHMTMEFKVSNLLIKRTAGTEALCGKKEQTAGTVTGTFNVTASREGKEVGFWFE